MSNQLEEVRTKYYMFVLFSILAAGTILVFGSTLIPIQYTQMFVLKDQGYSHGLQENILEVEENIQKGKYKLVDNVPFLVKTESYNATIIKMVEDTRGIPHTKYRLEIHFRYPYSDLPRHTKLDAILVDVNPEQNHDFADLFWNLE